LSEVVEDTTDSDGNSIEGPSTSLAQQGLELGEDLLIGFRSGKYFGRKINLAPAARMALRTALPL
jgi:hypothetical protein